MSIKKDSKRITITLTNEEQKIMHEIMHTFGYKTYTRAFRLILKSYLIGVNRNGR